LWHNEGKKPSTGFKEIEMDAKTKKYVIIAAVVVVLCCCCVVAGVGGYFAYTKFFAASGPGQVADSFIAAVKSGDFDTAYSLIDKDTAGYASGKELSNYLNSYGWDKISSSSASTVTIAADNKSAEVTIPVTFPNQNKGVFYLTLRDKSGWKITSVTVHNE
jgi:hypothetical protein